MEKLIQFRFNLSTLYEPFHLCSHTQDVLIEIIKYQLFLHSSKSLVTVQILLVLILKTATDEKIYTLYKWCSIT